MSLQPKKRKSDIDRERYALELRRRPPPGTQQLTLFETFAANTPTNYTNVLEFYDTLPKFLLTTQSSLRKKESLQIQRFETDWGDDRVSVVITPVVVDSKDLKTGEQVRKEVLPGPREETVYRVLKKMAADPDVEKVAKEKSVVLRFTCHQLRVRLREVGHEFKVSEIKEALEVLNRSAHSVTNLTRNVKLYAGNYIDLNYASDETDESGERTLMEVGFNPLAVAALRAQLYDRIHYQRLMSLSPLAAWIYERLTHNFRQATTEIAYRLSFKRVMQESGLPPRKEIRKNVEFVRRAVVELVDRGVLSAFPAYKEEVIFGEAARGGGRRPIKDVMWFLYPHEDVVRDIKSDNADQSRRRELAYAGR